MSAWSPDGNGPRSIGPTAAVGAGGFRRDLMMVRRSQSRHQNEHVCASGARQSHLSPGSVSWPDRMALPINPRNYAFRGAADRSAPMTATV